MTSSCTIEHLTLGDGIAASLATELVSTYASAFSLEEYFAFFHPAPPTDAVRILSRENGQQHLLFYRVLGNAVRVFNALFQISPESLDCFSDFVFERHGKVKQIDIDRVVVSLQNIRSPYLVKGISEDIVLALASTPEEYDASLSRDTRTHLRYYTNKLARENPNFRFVSNRSGAIDPSMVRRIVQMNRLRMESKGIVSGYDAAFEEGIVSLCRSHGLVGCLCLGDQVIAGTICYVVGQHAYLEAVSHDPAYNKTRAGQICLHLTIKDLIRSGFSTFHMLWGEYEYKYRFGGRRDEHYFLTIYRHALPRHYAAARKRAGEVMHVLRHYIRQCLVPRST